MNQLPSTYYGLLSCIFLGFLLAAHGEGTARFLMNDRYINFKNDADTFRCLQGLETEASFDMQAVTISSVVVPFSSHNLPDNFEFSFINGRTIQFSEFTANTVRCTATRTPMNPLPVMTEIPKVWCPRRSTFTAKDGERIEFDGFDRNADHAIMTQKDITLVDANYPVGFRTFHHEGKFFHIWKKNAGQVATILYEMRSPYMILLTSNIFIICHAYEEQVCNSVQGPAEFVDAVRNPSKALAKQKLNMREIYDLSKIMKVYQWEKHSKFSLILEQPENVVYENFQQAKYDSVDKTILLSDGGAENFVKLLGSFTEFLQILNPPVDATTVNDILINNSCDSSVPPVARMLFLSFKLNNADVGGSYYFKDATFRHNDYCFKFKREDADILCIIYFFPILTGPSNSNPKPKPDSSCTKDQLAKKAQLEIFPFIFFALLFNCAFSLNRLMKRRTAYRNRSKSNKRPKTRRPVLKKKFKQ